MRSWPQVRRKIEKRRLGGEATSFYVGQRLGDACEPRGGVQLATGNRGLVQEKGLGPCEEFRTWNIQAKGIRWQPCWGQWSGQRGSRSGLGERKGRAAPEIPGCGSENTEKRRDLGQHINKEVLKCLPVAVTQAPAPPAALIWVPLVWGNSTYSLCRTDPPPNAVGKPLVLYQCVI